jgi:hypothetical protein
MTEHHEPQLGVLGSAGFHDGPLASRFARNLLRGLLSPTLKFYSYAEATQWMARVRPAFPHFPCCFVGWDNTARRGHNAIVMVDSSPELFREQLKLMVDVVAEKHPQERIVFVNAWNEWAEGMYLEPDARFGHAYLEAISSVLVRGPRWRERPTSAATADHDRTSGIEPVTNPKPRPAS